MGFDLFTVEDAPALEQVHAGMRPDDDDPPGHWALLGRIDLFALGTRKLFFRYNLSDEAILCQALTSLSIENFSTPTPRPKDPIRTESPDLCSLQAVHLGVPHMVFVGGKLVPVDKISDDVTLEEQSRRLRAVEQQQQYQCGGRANASGRQCWNGACERPGTHRCTRCRQAAFCTRDCQKQAWMAHHRRQCQPPQPASLRQALFENQGFWILPSGECRAMAKALSLPGAVERALTTSVRADLFKVKEGEEFKMQREKAEFYRKMLCAFGAYCKSAADLGGFCVW